MLEKGIAGAGFQIVFSKLVRSVVSASTNKVFWHGNVCGEPLGGFGNALCLRFNDERLVALVVKQCGTEIPCVVTVGAQLLRLPGLLWEIILVPSGPRRVRLKSKSPWSCAWAERRGLMREARSKFSVTCTCLSMRSESCIGNLGRCRRGWR